MARILITGSTGFIGNNLVIYFLKNPEMMKQQISDCEKTLSQIRSKTSSSEEASFVLTKFLTS